MTGGRVVITHNENELIQKGFVIVPNAKGSMLLDGCNFYTDDVSNFIIHNQAPGFHIEMDNCHVTKYGTNWW